MSYQFANHLWLNGAPHAVAAARQRLLGPEVSSPLPCYRFCIVDDAPESLWLTFGSATALTVEELAQVAAVLPVSVVQHVVVDAGTPPRGESRLYFAGRCIEVEELSSADSAAWLLAARPIPSVVKVGDMTVVGSGGEMSGEVADWLARRVGVVKA